jgi:hypothetical protein
MRLGRERVVVIAGTLWLLGSCALWWRSAPVRSEERSRLAVDHVECAGTDNVAVAWQERDDDDDDDDGWTSSQRAIHVATVDRAGAVADGVIDRRDGETLCLVVEPMGPDRFALLSLHASGQFVVHRFAVGLEAERATETEMGKMPPWTPALRGRGWIRLDQEGPLTRASSAEEKWHLSPECQLAATDSEVAVAVRGDEGPAGETDPQRFQYLALLASDGSWHTREGRDPVRIGSAGEHVVTYRERWREPLGRGEWVIAPGRPDERRLAAEPSPFATQMKQTLQDHLYGWQCSSEWQKSLTIVAVAGGAGSLARLWTDGRTVAIDGIRGGRPFSYGPERLPSVYETIAESYLQPACNGRFQLGMGPHARVGPVEQPTVPGARDLRLVAADDGFRVEPRGRRWQQLGWRVQVSAASPPGLLLRRPDPRTSPGPVARSWDHDLRFDGPPETLTCGVGAEGATLATSHGVRYRRNPILAWLRRGPRLDAVQIDVLRGDRRIRAYASSLPAKIGAPAIGWAAPGLLLLLGAALISLRALLRLRAGGILEGERVALVDGAWLLQLGDQECELRVGGASIVERSRRRRRGELPGRAPVVVSGPAARAGDPYRRRMAIELRAGHLVFVGWTAAEARRLARARLAGRLALLLLGLGGVAWLG